MSVQRCARCGANVLEPEHACTVEAPLTAEIAVDFLRVGPPGNATYDAWLEIAETKVAIKLRILPRRGAR